MRISDHTYTTLKRAQVWTGVVPIGLFLVSHVLTNARAIAGPEAFDRAAAEIGRIPFLPQLELVAVALPLLVHVALGAWLGTTAQSAADAGGYSPRLLLAQRATGFVLVVYVMFHVWSTRLSPARLAGDSHLFALTARALSHPGMLSFHVAGVLSAAFHFGNGLKALAGPWGLALGEAGQQRLARLGLAASVVLGLVGLHALIAFVSPTFRWLAPRTAVAP